MWPDYMHVVHKMKLNSQVTIQSERVTPSRTCIYLFKRMRVITEQQQRVARNGKKNKTAETDDTLNV